MVGKGEWSERNQHTSSAACCCAPPQLLCCDDCGRVASQRPPVSVRATCPSGVSALSREPLGASATRPQRRRGDFASTARPWPPRHLARMLPTRRPSRPAWRSRRRRPRRRAGEGASAAHATNSSPSTPHTSSSSSSDRRPYHPPKVAVAFPCSRAIASTWSTNGGARRISPTASRSSRYTIWDFLPKQFFFQATRLNNVYFIAIGIPQAIPGISTTGNYTTILPLLFFICLTVAKEGYDDYRRHRLDKVENNHSATVLRPKNRTTLAESWLNSLKSTWSILLRPIRKKTQKPTHCHEEVETDVDDIYEWATVQWHDINVGDIVRLKRNDALPADIALLYASNENGVAYVETAALDGESNLKSKQAPHDFEGCGCIEGLKAAHAEFVLGGSESQPVRFQRSCYCREQREIRPIDRQRGGVPWICASQHRTSDRHGHQFWRRV